MYKYLLTVEKRPLSALLIAPIEPVEITREQGYCLSTDKRFVSARTSALSTQKQENCLSENKGIVTVETRPLSVLLIATIEPVEIAHARQDVALFT